jgi:hypothetical protein
MFQRLHKTLLSSPSQRNVLHITASQPFAFMALPTTQVRTMTAKHAPKFEKGKIKFKHNEKMKKVNFFM